MKKGNHCPLIRKDCIENKCAWYCQVRGTNPNTGQEVDEWQCAVNLLPILLIENSNQQRQTAASVQSFRNETVQRADLLNTIFAKGLESMGQVAHIEPVTLREIPPG